jgi:hypothetical protein
MSLKSFVETDTRVLKEDYCNHDLIARCWNDEYRGRVWKNKERVADFEGTDLDEIMRDMRAIVDGIQHDKREARGRRKPTPREIADAIAGIEPKLSRAQKMMLAIHAKAPGQRIMLKALTRVGDFASPELALTEYAQVARRLCDELAYHPGSRRKDVYPGSSMLLNDELVIGTTNGESVLVLRPEMAKALELLKW